VSSEFDSPRVLPDELIKAWEAAGLWTRESVSDVVDGDTDVDRVACVVDDQRLTFGDLRRWSTAVARYLSESGVTRGDRIVMQLPNCAELVVSVLAAWRLGAVAVPVVPLFREHELRSVITQSRPAAVISTGMFRSRTPLVELDAAIRACGIEPLARLSVSGTTIGWSTFPAIDAPGDGEQTGLVDPSACALILFTSGTTAEPKGVRHDSRSLLAEARSYVRAAGLTADDVVFNPAPIAHIGAVVATVLLPWFVGVRVVLLSSWDSDRASALITDERVTFAIGAPVFLSELVSRYEQPEFVGHRVSSFQTGAAPTAGALLRRAEHVGVITWRAWGMTEAPTISYGRPVDSVDNRMSTDGRIEPGSEVVAVNEFQIPVPAGIEGELRLRSPKQMLGYIEDVVSQSDPDGWVYTGDLGTVDADGWVRITGRIKDIINRGGEKFSARDVENALCDHPSIDAAAVIGVPEERLGEKVVAYVTVRPGASFPGFEAMIEHLRASHVALQKFPATIEILADLPRTATGKTRKHDLVEQWMHDHTRA
jgi:acyl-CoA synthetase (AMP-forming)/AMP-acid ligase II